MPKITFIDASGASRHRPAVTVKIDNTRSGWPKYGVEQADVIYEEVATHIRVKGAGNQPSDVNGSVNTKNCKFTCP